MSYDNCRLCLLFDCCLAFSILLGWFILGKGGNEIVSIQPPPTPGFSSPRNLHLVCKLKKAIYVTTSDKLKQAPRAWF